MRHLLGNDVPDADIRILLETVKDLSQSYGRSFTGDEVMKIYGDLKKGGCE